MITKMTKWLVDNNPNLSPWEKLGQKLMANVQIADPIDRCAECRCDWVDFGYECMRNSIRHTSCSWQEEQQRLHCLHDGAEFIKFQIRQQAENDKRRRDEQERVRWILSTAAPRQPMFYSCKSRVG